MSANLAHALVHTWWHAIFASTASASHDGESGGHSHRASSRVAAQNRYESSAVLSDTDQRLLERLASHDTTAFEELFTAHVMPMYTLALRYVRSADAARDVVQEVFVRLWDRRAALTMRTSLANYLLRATRNQALNALRSDRRAQHAGQTASQDATVASMPQTSDARVAASDLQHAYRRALEQLPPRGREIFLLHREQGMSYRDIAALLGIAEQTVSNQVSRALATLRQALREWL